MEKFSWKYYIEPTPRRLKRLGAAIVASGGTLSGSSIFAAITSEEKNEDLLWFALIVLIVTGFGHFMVEFFKAEEEEYMQNKNKTKE